MFRCTRNSVSGLRAPRLADVCRVGPADLLGSSTDHCTGAERKHPQPVCSAAATALCPVVQCLRVPLVADRLLWRASSTDCQVKFYDVNAPGHPSLQFNGFWHLKSTQERIASQAIELGSLLASRRQLEFCARRLGTMPRGPKKHLKRLNAPSHWMLDKLGGVFVSSRHQLMFALYHSLSRNPMEVHSLAL